MRRSAVRKHMLPGVLGIILGLITGLSRTLPAVTSSDLLKHRMFYSAAYSVQNSSNIYMLVACGVFYALHIRTLSRGRSRLLCSLLAGIVFLRGVIMFFGLENPIRDSLKDINLVTFKAILSVGYLQILVSVLLVTIVAITIRRMRRRKAVLVSEELSPDLDSRVNTVAHNATMALECCTPLFVAVFTVFLLIELLPVAISAKNAREMSQPPNIIYIVIDTLRSDHLGCYGYSRNTSPNIDKLAAQSMLFSNAISQAPGLPRL